jgi:uncharacterized protein
MRAAIIIGVLILFIVLIYFLIGLKYFLNQDRFVYYPIAQINMYPSDIGLDYEDVWLGTEDGIMINAWFFEQKKSDKVVLVFHGNGGNISYNLDLAKGLLKYHFSVMLLDYRGYGKSKGKPSEEGTYLDSQAAFDYLLTQKGYKPDDIILLGRSLGGPIAARLASISSPRALVLDSTFTSLKDIGSKVYPFLPVRRFFKFDYDTLSYIKRTDIPVLIIHSTEDDTIPFDHAQRLLEAVNTKKRLIEIKGNHNSSFAASQDIYLETMRKFIDNI